MEVVHDCARIVVVTVGIYCPVNSAHVKIPGLILELSVISCSSI